LLAADHHAKRAQHAQNFGDAALVEDVHLDAAAHEFGGDVGLQVREAEHEVRLEARMRSIFADVNADTRGFSRRARGGRTVKPEMPTMRQSRPAGTGPRSFPRSGRRCGTGSSTQQSYG